MRKDEGVIKNSGQATISPYNSREMLIVNPEQPKYGPINYFYQRAESYFG